MTRVAAMTPPYDLISEPVPISLIAGRFLLFDINVVTYLRKTHHICGVLIGSIPQVPQQNVFLGLPVELLPEEARLVVGIGAAYIADDAAQHKQRFSALEGTGRRKYLDSLRSEGLKARKAAEWEARKRSELALAKQAAVKVRNESSTTPITKDRITASDVSNIAEGESSERPLFDDELVTPAPATTIASTAPYALTPTVSYPPVSVPQNPAFQRDPPVPSSYPLFAHLHSHDYFITPGLRFGCDYTVYPGDPLRFHSHFLAVGYGWNADIPMLDVVGGGRLGTGVKKGFLIGGQNLDAKPEGGDGVRTFCIEWGGM